MDMLLLAVERVRTDEVERFQAQGGKIQKLHVKRKRGIFKCDKCSSVFGLRHNLLRHERTIHQRRRPFKCNVEGCNSTFVQRFDLDTHRESVHERRRDHMCNSCGKGFSQKSNLLSHIRMAHSTFWPCPHCYYIGNSRQQIKKHLKACEGMAVDITDESSDDSDCNMMSRASVNDEAIVGDETDICRSSSTIAGAN